MDYSPTYIIMLSKEHFNPRPAGPLDIPPPAGGVVENPPSISAPGPRSDTR